MKTSKKHKLSANHLAILQQESREALSQLIFPITVEEFFSDYWEKKPLLIKGCDRKISEYTGFFSKAQLDTMFEDEELEFGSVDDLCVCRCDDGQKVVFFPTEEDTACNNVLDASALNQYFDEEKCTLQIHQPQRFQEDGPLPALMSQLEDVFQTLVGANVYITPAGSQGLAPHWDDVEVFIIQLEGTKRWKLYPTNSPYLPDTCSDDLEYSEIGSPDMDFVLSPGDVLYFPRGTIHEASTSEEMSSHLTVSTYQRQSWGNFLVASAEHAVGKLISSGEDLRKGLPVGFSSYMGSIFSVSNLEGNSLKLRTEFKSQFKQYLQYMILAIDEDEVVDSFVNDFIESRLPPIPPKALPVEALTVDSRVKMTSLSKFRVEIDEFGECLRMTSSLSNSQMNHMFGKNEEEENIHIVELPLDQLVNVCQLVRGSVENPDVFQSIKNISADSQSFLELCQKLLEEGLLETER